MQKPKYITKIKDITELGNAEQADLEAVSEEFVFRSNDYYQGLIDWNDPNDPIRHIVVPMKRELDEWGNLDASDEEKYTVLPGLQHKYRDTALLLLNNVCGAYCRFCFRKRLFMDDNDETIRDVTAGLEYIREHSEITNVLLSGGDPLILPTPMLEGILKRIREIDHVKIIRIGSKMPAFNPARILNDPSLLNMISEHSTPFKKIYIMAHFNHSRELTDVAIEALNLLQRSGAITVNQTPLIRGVNDGPAVLVDLLNRLSFVGVASYYIFQCRPTLGNKPYTLPVEQAYDVFSQAQSNCSGLAKRARFVMSHSTGKIEIIGKTDEHILMRYHQAADPANKSRVLMFPKNPAACWFDDYVEAANLREAAGYARGTRATSTLAYAKG